MKLTCSLTRLTSNSMIILFALLFVYACTMPIKQNDLLQSAESLMKSQSDSALALLVSISPGRLTTLAEQAQYALLLTQAQDKNGITHTSDSLIRIAVNYYDSIEDNTLSAKAHYYLGRVHQDTDNPGATTFKDNRTHQLSRQYELFLFYYKYGLVGLLVTSVLFLLYLWKKHHHKVDILAKEHHAVKKKIAEMAAELNEKNQQLDQYQKLYLHNMANYVKNEKLQARIKKITEERDQLAKTQLASSLVYTKLKELQDWNNLNPDSQRAIENTISWDELRTAINSIFSQFADRLSNQYRLLREGDLLFCCLVKCGFTYTDIANVLACTPNAVYKRRETIVARLKQPLTADQFMKFIQEF